MNSLTTLAAAVSKEIGCDKDELKKALASTLLKSVSSQITDTKTPKPKKEAAPKGKAAKKAKEEVEDESEEETPKKGTKASKKETKKGKAVKEPEPEESEEEAPKKGKTAKKETKDTKKKASKAAKEEEDAGEEELEEAPKKSKAAKEDEAPVFDSEVGVCFLTAQPYGPKGTAAVILTDAENLESLVKDLGDNVPSKISSDKKMNEILGAHVKITSKKKADAVKKYFEENDPSRIGTTLGDFFSEEGEEDEE